MNSPTLALMVAAGLLLMAPHPATAAAAATVTMDAGVDINDIRAEQMRISESLRAPGGSLSEMTAKARRSVEALQVTVSRLLEGKNSIDELDPGQRDELVTALASIEATVVAVPERMVCKMAKSTGSNMKQRTCLTASQMKLQEEAARRQIDRHGIDSIIQRN